MGSNSIKEILKKCSKRSDQIFVDRFYLFSIYWIEETSINMLICSYFRFSSNCSVRAPTCVFVSFLWVTSCFKLFISKYCRAKKKYQYHRKYRLVKCQSWISYFSVILYEDWQNKKLQYCDRNFWRLVEKYFQTRGC